MAPTPPQADWAKKNYPNSKNDLCVMFVERNFDFLKQSGYLAMITMHSWMFLSSYEKFRERLIDTRDIVNLAHLGARAFEEIGGEVVQTTVFAMRCYDVLNYLGTYARLVDYANQQAKENAFLMGSNRFFTKKRNFEKIPGRPVAYWVSERFADTFTLTKLGEIAKSCIGMRTGNNALFLRYWYETSYAKILFSACSAEDVVEKEAKWIPYNKGGEFRKWYGNQEYIVNWEDNGHEIKENTKRAYPQLGNNLGWKITNEQFYFQGGISWTVITNNPCFRRYYNGYIFSNSGQSVISIDPKLLDYLTGLLNTKYAESVLKIISPTLGFESGYVSKIPVIIDHNKIDIVISLVNETITISRTDWDNFETSWNFKQHPLIKFSMTEAFVCGNAKPSSGISSSFRAWNKFAETQFDILKSNETKLNRIFIDMYDLQDELTPEVDDKDVSIRKADLGRDIRSFLSYTVGCMFGRYSLDEPGLVFAGGEFDMLRYETYTPEDDNILPIGSSDYFNDDIVVRFVDFVRIVYGDTTLDENLNFIADALYPNANGSAKEKIRRYFLNDFYKDHLKIYQKRPIYWMLDSGKKNGFKALFYLHRYDKYTIACARTDYLHPLQRKYEAEINRLEMLSGTTENAREKAGYRKEGEVLQSKIAECRSYDQVVAHIAHQQIDLDLDDGVKVNYAKFQGVEVPLDNGKIVKMDLLGKI